MRTPLRGVRTVGDRTLTLLRSGPTPDGRLRVLCVDDEEDIRVILEMSLVLDADIAVEVVAEGATLLQLAATGDYDVILLDAMMPGMDGYEVCRRLKANEATAHIPVIFLTAKTQRDEIERARALGAIDCLKKPFDPMTISRELRATLATALQLAS